ncbi:MAG: hypothetical protein U0074_08200 [Kouleothrix sp.]
MATITTFTPQAAQQNLQNDGLSALGLASLLLAPRWDTTTPGGGAYDATNLTLTLSSPRAPFRAVREFTDGPSAYSGPDGAALSGSAAIVRLHPQAVQRLERLAAVRYALPGAAPIRPVPWAMVVRGWAGTTTPQWYEADEALTGASNVQVSFHDGRGLIIDPIAVAAMFADLLAAFPALQVPNAGGTLGGPGGLTGIAGLASGTLIHVIEPHGAVYQPAVPAATIITTDSGGNPSGTMPASGLIALATGQRIAGASGDSGRLRWGWAMNGTLARTPLVPPDLPITGTPAPTLPRQFLRVCAVDVRWHILGNRSGATVLGIGPDDGHMPESLLPTVRDQATIDYLVDGVDTLAASGQVLGRLGGSGALVFAVSPTLDAGVGLPPATGAAGHWPAFPLPNTGAGFPATPVSPATGITAAWSGTNDVVVTVAAAAVPAGAHVRIFPQRFVEIAAIGEEPSFVRGDGGAAIGDGTNPVAVFLPNPFGLLQGQPRPSPANLTLDIAIAPRNGPRRLTAAVSVAVGAGPAAAPADQFATPDPMAPIPDMVKAICPVPLFGLARPPAPGGGLPTNPIDLVRRLASETSPREGPRLPTMARFESMIVTGIAAGDPNGRLAWDGVLSGGRWARETRSALHSQANPGNPAGPDVHAASVRVTDQLGYDLARHAVRRAQPIVPLPGGAATPGWLVMSGGNNFNPPDPGAPANTGVGAVLQTIAAVCETPELSLPAIDLSPNTLTLNDVLNAIASALGLGSPPAVSVTNGDRLVDEVRREFFVARHGIRDALWALRRAIRQARELVYIESAQFARTARPGGSPQPHEIDLVAELAQRMTEHPNLRVIICTPRQGDFAPAYRGWARQAFQARQQAINDLKAVDANRVVAFHPVGFPGRAAQIRTTSVIVDDVWCMVGTSHWRRRGMTFDGAADVVSFDRAFEDGYSKKVRAFRRALIAAKLGVAAPASGAAPSGDWVRLARPRAAFEAVAETLAQGGFGRILPLWLGPTDTSVLPATADMADPDGANGATFVTAFASLLAELGD